METPTYPPPCLLSWFRVVTEDQNQLSVKGQAGNILKTLLSKKYLHHQLFRDFDDTGSLDESVENMERGSLASFGSGGTTDSDSRPDHRVSTACDKIQDTQDEQDGGGVGQLRKLLAETLSWS